MMLDLALQGDEVVRIKDISLRQEISEKYLEQIVSVLKKPDMSIVSEEPRGDTAWPENRRNIRSE